MSKTLTRRSFMKTAAVTGAVGALGLGAAHNMAPSDKAWADNDVHEVRTSCRACIANCGVIATVSNGRVIKLRGDSIDPMSKGRMCPKGLSGIQALYHPNRNKYPMKRVGERGGNQWERISWEEAIDTIADALMDMKEKTGLEGLLLSTGGGGNPQFFSPPRFRNFWGAGNVFEPGCAQCYLPRNFTMPLVNGIGERSSDMVEAVQKSYDEGVTDEFIKPFVRIDENGQPVGMIRPNDVVIFFNYRNDRAKELTIVLTQQDMPEAGMHTIPGLQYYCMTPYDASFKGVHILFDKENVHNTLGEYLSKSHKTQLHIAETEKYAHVTFFFNGGREAPFEGEDRILVPSPKVATYDLKPEMSAYEVKDKLVAAIDENKYDFIVVNYANGDMVGHTGVYSAIEKAVVAIDACVRDTVEAAKANGYEVIIIADHGNADNAENADGTPNTAHSLNPVPFVYVTENKNARVEDGILADVAPSICHIMGLPQPAEMTGHDLLK